MSREAAGNGADVVEEDDQDRGGGGEGSQGWRPLVKIVSA